MDNEKIIAELQDIVAKIPRGDDLGDGAAHAALQRVKISLNQLIAQLGSTRTQKFHSRSRGQNV